MARFKNNNLVVFTMTILLGASLIFSGCSESPTSVDVSNPQPQVLKRADMAEGISLAPVDLYKEAVILSSTGGRLQLLDVILDVPPGAVPNDTIYSIFIPDDEIFFNEFGTDGLVFDVPVTVTMSYRNADLGNIDEGTIRIGWWDEHSGQWEDMECVLDQENKVVIGKLSHFSPYGLISD